MSKFEHKRERADYLERNPECEIYHLLQGPEWNRIDTSFYMAGMFNVCVHHVCRRKSPVFDTLPNWISLGCAGHSWVHENEAVGLVVCLFVKLKKNELDLAVLNSCLGAVRPDANPLGAKLQSCVVPSWCRGMLDEVRGYVEVGT